MKLDNNKKGKAHQISDKLGKAINADINVEKLKADAHIISEFFKSVIDKKQMKIWACTRSFS